MQHPILKMTALAGVVGIGFLVVYQAQKGMSRPTDKVDATQAFVELAGDSADGSADAPPPQGAGAEPTLANPDEKFPFGKEPAAAAPATPSGISFLEQTEPKVDEASPPADSHHDLDGAKPKTEIAATPKDAGADTPFDPLAAAADPKSKPALEPIADAPELKSAQHEPDAGVKQTGFDPLGNSAPPTLAEAKEPPKSDVGVASVPSAAGAGGPQLFAPNPDPSAPAKSETEHGQPEAFPFDAKNAPRPISEKDDARPLNNIEPAAADAAGKASIDTDKPDAGPLAPTADPLNEKPADHAAAAKDPLEPNPLGDLPEAKKKDAEPIDGGHPKALENTAGDSIPVDLGAPKEKIDAAPALDRQAPNLDVPDPTLSNPFGAAGKSGPDLNPKADADSGKTEPSETKIDVPPPTDLPKLDEPPAAKDLNDRPKVPETIPIPQRHEAPKEEPAPKSSEDAEPPLIHGEGNAAPGDELPKITPRFPKRGDESPKAIVKPTIQSKDAEETDQEAGPKPADALNGDGTIREDAPQGPQQPRLKLEKSAPTNAIIGQPLVYNIFVENVGSSPAHKVVVQDRIPRGSKLSGTIPRAELINRQLTWKLGTLDPGEKQRISVRVTPTDAGTLGSVATVSFEAQVAARTVITAPRVSVDAIGPQRAKIGEPVTFHFKVTNEGTGIAQKVVLRNILPQGLNHAAGKELEYEVGTLTPGATRDIELTLTAAEAGEMVNRTVVTTADGFSAETKSQVKVEDLGLVITREGPGHRVVGRAGAYINTVTNRSSQPMYGVHIVESVPEGMEFVEASDGGKYDATQRKVLWQVETLNAGEDRKVQVKLTPRDAGEMSSSVLAIDRNGNKVETTSRTAVTGFASVTLEIPPLPGPVEVGEPVTLRIEAGNKGSSPATNVRLQIKVSEEMELVSIKGATAHERNGNAMRFAPIPSLGERTPAVFEITLKARRSGDARVAVQIEADQLSKPVHREEAILILPAGQ